jgi:hypothetical protein
MSYTNDQWRSAITKLLTMTSKNEIRWQRSELYEGDAWTVVDSSLAAEVGDKAYVISQTRTKHFFDEEQYAWIGGFVFSIFVNTGFHGYQKIATAPELSSLNGLFEAAENNMAFNRKALDDLLD